ncbi:MAG TPA: NrdH-redoxin, partial [Polyangiaceae bacterium]|nr:NrdH-redoxin [Polyangiaceae bacterium]
MLRRPHRLVLCALLLAVGCHTRTHSDAENNAAPKTNELPALSIKADTPNLLLTWIDDKGDFHVVDKPADVPAEARGAVRVVATDKEAGTSDQVYVADLNQTAPDGSYKVKTLSRGAWDELGASKRKSRLEALAPASAAPSSSA